jgi:uncharacterized UBP type Zn finger protein
MGYPRRACAEALKQVNNRLEEASEILLTNLDTLIAVSQPTRDNNDDDDDQEIQLMEDATHIPQLIALGAEFEEARALLEIHGNRLDRAAEELLQKIKNPEVTNTEQSTITTTDLFERAHAIAEKRGKNRNIDY